MKTVSILGCGWYGQALATALLKDGFAVKGSTTTNEKLLELDQLGIDAYKIKIDSTKTAYNPAFFDCDLLIVSIPPGVHKGGGGDFIEKTRQLIDIIHKQNIKQVIYISSTGVYGDNQGTVNEFTAPLPNTQSGELLYEAEQLLGKQKNFTSTIIRFGGLVGPGRHPGRFFAGKNDIPNGQTPVNLIYLDDAVGITQAIIKQEAFGHIFNACSPQHPSKAYFYTMAARHAALVEPKFRDELLGTKLVNSINVPQVLNYQFRVTNWDSVYGA